MRHRNAVWVTDRYRRYKNRPNFIRANPQDDADPTTIAANPKSSKERRGTKTNLIRPAYPKVFRRFGSNTRATVYPLPNTGILDNIYDPSLFHTGQGHTSLIPEENRTHLGQGGASKDLLGAVPALASGSHHWLFATRSR